MVIKKKANPPKPIKRKVPPKRGTSSKAEKGNETEAVVEKKQKPVPKKKQTPPQVKKEKKGLFSRRRNKNKSEVKEPTAEQEVVQETKVEPPKPKPRTRPAPQAEEMVEPKVEILVEPETEPKEQPPVEPKPKKNPPRPPRNNSNENKENKPPKLLKKSSSVFKKHAESLTESNTFASSRSKFSSALLKYLGINTSRMISELEVQQLRVNEIVKPHEVAYTDGFMTNTKFPTVQSFVDNNMFGRIGNEIIEQATAPVMPVVESPFNQQTEIISLDNDSDIPPSAPMDDLNKPLFGTDELAQTLDFGSDTETNPTQTVTDDVEIIELDGGSNEEVTETISLDEDNTTLLTEPNGMEGVTLFPEETETPESLFPDVEIETIGESTEPATVDSTAVATTETIPLFDEEPQTLDMNRKVDEEFNLTEPEEETTPASKDDNEFEPVDKELLEEEGKSALGAIDLTATTGQNEISSFDLGGDSDPLAKDAVDVIETELETEPVSADKVEHSNEGQGGNGYFNPSTVDNKELNLNNNEDEDNVMVFGSASQPSSPTLNSHTFTMEAFESLKVVNSELVGNVSILGLKEENAPNESEQAILETVTQEQQEEQIRNANSFIDALRIRKGGE